MTHGLEIAISFFDLNFIMFDLNFQSIAFFEVASLIKYFGTN